MSLGKDKEFDLNNVQAVEEPVVENYVRKDSETGFVNDKQEISQLRATRKYDMVVNNLLGEFSADGRYTIDPHIMAELIALPKYIIEDKDGEILAKAEFKDGTQFTFTLTAPQKLPDGNALCALKLNETIERANGYIQDTISTIVGSYCFKYDEHYNTRRVIVFNLREKKEEDDKQKTPTDNIELRLAYLQAVRESGSDLYEKLEENYFNKRIQLLNELPNGTIVLSEFKKARDKIGKYFLTGRHKFRAMNELLTAILESQTGEALRNNPQFMAMMGALNNKYYAVTEKISERINASGKVKDLKAKQEATKGTNAGMKYKEIMISYSGDKKAEETKQAAKGGKPASKGGKDGGKSGGSKSGGGKKGGGSKGGKKGGGSKKGGKDKGGAKKLGGSISYKPVATDEPQEIGSDEAVIVEHGESKKLGIISDDDIKVDGTETLRGDDVARSEDGYSEDDVATSENGGRFM